MCVCAFMCVYVCICVKNLWDMCLVRSSPFWSVGAAWPERCGKRRWWRGSAVQDLHSGGLCWSAGRSSECRSLHTPWSECKALYKANHTETHSQRDNLGTEVLSTACRNQSDHSLCVNASHPQWCSSPVTGGCSCGAPVSSWWRPLCPHAWDGRLRGKRPKKNKKNKWGKKKKKSFFCKLGEMKWT